MQCSQRKELFSVRQQSLTHFIKNIIFFSVSMKHAMFTEEGGKFSVEPMEANVRLLVNGKAIGTKTAISHNDRIIFGTTKYFVFVNPKERDSSKQPHTEITFEMAQEEIAKKSGFDIEGQNKSRGKFFHSFLYARLQEGAYYGIPMSDCPSVRPFHMSRSNLRTPWPIHFKFHRVIGIDGLTVCILYGEISNFHSRVVGLYSSNCRRFFVCHAVN